VPARDPVDDALAVSWATIAWSTTTGIAAAIAGVLAHSLSVVGLGVTVLLDVVSSVVLVWRFRHERLGVRDVEQVERVAHRVACTALGAFGVLLAVQAVRNQISGAEADTTVAAIGLAIASVVALPLLARWKYRAAATVGSPALRADAHITAVGAAMAAVTLVGLVVGADSLAALVLGATAAWLGASGLRGR
jgi:divalent metal cation (Fe/Co/Zn/Cd) transporter